PDIVVVGEADSGLTAIEVSERVHPDVVVLDLDMPGSDGLAALRGLKQTLPSVQVLILTVHAEQERLVPLLEAGARGHLHKEAASQDLVEAVRVVASGEVYVRPATARLLAAAIVPQHAARTARDRFETLSDREQTTLRLLAGGHTGAEIARRLGISTKTVEGYKHRVQEKLGLVHRTDYVRFAIEAGLLDSDRPGVGKTAPSPSALPDTAPPRHNQP